jgi:hypothetical protein
VRASLTLLLIPALGCGSALDLESARAIFRRPEPPAVPLLAEEPVPLAAPAGLQSFSGRLRAIALSWDPVLAGEVAGYVIERSLDAEGPFEPIAHVSGRFQTTFVDRGSDLAVKRGSDQALTGLGDGEEYTYRVRSFRSDGRRGAQTSPLASSFTAAVPESPEGLRAYSHLPRRVALSWRPVDDPTVAGYVVYRSPSASGEFRQIARIDDAYETSFVDRNLGALRVFYYRVATRNAAGGEGPAAEAVRAVTKPEPLPPVGLAVAKRSCAPGRTPTRPRSSPRWTRSGPRRRIGRWVPPRPSSIAWWRSTRTAWRARPRNRSGSRPPVTASRLAPSETPFACPGIPRFTPSSRSCG